MPLAIPRPLREELVARRLAGEELTAIAAALGLAYRTVRGLWARYRQLGEGGLDNSYLRCAQRGPRYDRVVYEAALALRGVHPRWGAGLIRLELGEQLAGQSLPSERTLRRWLHEAGLQPVRSKRPRSAGVERGRHPHAVWQIDAKERLVLGDGQGCSQMSVVDECSGASLGAVAFPPRALEPGAPAGGTRGPL